MTASGILIALAALYLAKARQPAPAPSGGRAYFSLDGRIYAADLQTGDRVAIATAPAGQAYRLVVDESGVYWFTAAGPSFQLRRVPLPGA